MCSRRTLRRKTHQPDRAQHEHNHEPNNEHNHEPNSEHDHEAHKPHENQREQPKRTFATPT